MSHRAQLVLKAFSPKKHELICGAVFVFLGLLPVKMFSKIFFEDFKKRKCDDKSKNRKICKGQILVCCTLVAVAPTYFISLD